jgi:hypothetical protein
MHHMNGRIHTSSSRKNIYEHQKSNICKSRIFVKIHPSCAESIHPSNVCIICIREYNDSSRQVIVNIYPSVAVKGHPSCESRHSSIR